MTHIQTLLNTQIRWVEASSLHPWRRLVKIPSVKNLKQDTTPFRLLPNRPNVVRYTTHQYLIILPIRNTQPTISVRLWKQTTSNTSNTMMRSTPRRTSKPSERQRMRSGKELTQSQIMSSRFLLFRLKQRLKLQMISHSELKNLVHPEMKWVDQNP